MYTNLRRNDLLSDLRRDINILSLNSDYTAMNIDNLSDEELDALHYCIIVCGEDISSQNNGDTYVSLQELAEVVSRMHSIEEDLRQQYPNKSILEHGCICSNFNTFNFYVNNPEHYHFVAYNRLSFAKLFAEHLQAGLMFPYEEFITSQLEKMQARGNIARLVGRNQKIENYLGWRQVGQKPNALLTDYLVDIHPKHGKLVGKLLKQGIHPTYLLPLIKDIPKLEKYLDLAKSGQFDLIKYKELFLFCDEPLMQMCIKNIEAGRIPLILFKSEEYLTLMTDKQNKPKEPCKTSALTLQFIANYLYKTNYSISEDFQRETEVYSYLEKLPCHPMTSFIILLELAREQGIDLQEDIPQLEKYILRSKDMDTFLTKCCRQLLLGNDLTVYMKLNLPTNEIYDMCVSQSQLPPDFKFKSFAYKLYNKIRQ